MWTSWLIFASQPVPKYIIVKAAFIMAWHHSLNGCWSHGTLEISRGWSLCFHVLTPVSRTNPSSDVFQYPLVLMDILQCHEVFQHKESWFAHIHRYYTCTFLKVLKNWEDIKSHILNWLENGSGILENDLENCKLKLKIEKFQSDHTNFR